jgi:hypothetical protein
VPFAWLAHQARFRFGVKAFASLADRSATVKIFRGELWFWLGLAACRVTITVGLLGEWVPNVGVARRAPPAAVGELLEDAILNHNDVTLQVGVDSPKPSSQPMKKMPFLGISSTFMAVQSKVAVVSSFVHCPRIPGFES